MLPASGVTRGGIVNGCGEAVLKVRDKPFTYATTARISDSLNTPFHDGIAVAGSPSLTTRMRSASRGGRTIPASVGSMAHLAVLRVDALPCRCSGGQFGTGWPGNIGIDLWGRLPDLDGLGVAHARVERATKIEQQQQPNSE